MKFGRMVALMLALLLLMGCNAGTGETTAPTSPSETAPAVTEPVVETTEPVPVELDAVNLLSGQNFSATPSVAVLDERTVAFLNTEYDRNRSITVSHLMVLDLYTDTVLGQLTLDFAVSLPVQSQLPGVLPVFDISGDRWIVLNRKLEEVMAFDCDESGGVFNKDMSAYYYISAQRLCRMDLATGQTELVNTELTLPVDEIADYRMDENVILLDVHTQYYLTKVCVGVVDLTDGSLMLLSEEGAQGYFTSDGVVLQGSEVATSSDLIVTDLSDENAQRLDTVLPSDSVYRSWCIPMSDYSLTLYYDSRSAYKLSSFLLYRYGQTYESCELYELTDGIDPDKIVTLPGGNLLVVDYARRITKLALICPDQLEFTAGAELGEHTLTLVDTTIAEHYAQQAAPVELPEELADVRAQADELEQKYDITILLSNQCDSIIEECGFELQPTDKAQLAEEAKKIRDALKELDKALSLYPDGFFTQFRNEADERGILVLLVENISSGAVGVDDDNVDVLGVTYDMGDWYPIAVDVTTADLNATYCHEIWHAMENKINDEDPMLFNDVMWAKLNPSGFSYKGIVEGYYYDTEYTYIGGGAGKDSYFVDAYGKTRTYEDRARIMEYVMTTDHSARKMMEAPVLYEKMQIMINAVREIFDTTGWENVHWERFHK